jgi:hypothetical protein
MPANARIISPGNPIGLLWMSFDIGRANGETDTGFDFKKGDIIIPHFVFVDVQVAEATGGTKTVDVGMLSSEASGDADGFLAAVSVAATGCVAYDATATDGATQNFWAAAPKLGALVRTGLLGANVAADAGVLMPKPYVCDGTTVSLSYSLPNAFTEFVGKGYIGFLRSPQRLG